MAGFYDDSYEPDAWRSVKPFPPKRKPVSFVPAGATPSTFPEPARPVPQLDGKDVQALYLSIVGLSPSPSPNPASPSSSTADGALATCTPIPASTPPPTDLESTAAATAPVAGPTPTSATADREPKADICPVCNLPVTTDELTHVLSMAHQSSLPHSVPPHNLPRSSVGLRILQSSGWDPDSRRGLGTEGEGRRYPIRVEKKVGRSGVGVKRRRRR